MSIFKNSYFGSYPIICEILWFSNQCISFPIWYFWFFTFFIEFAIFNNILSQSVSNQINIS
jgi:hypothetical protein